MLSAYATNDVNSWMNDVVVIEHDGPILKGEYDGYGRVGEHEIRLYFSNLNTFDNEPCCYHEACWRKIGGPTDYKPSESSEDQGYFFNDPEHDMECPL